MLQRWLTHFLNLFLRPDHLEALRSWPVLNGSEGMVAAHPTGTRTARHHSRLFHPLAGLINFTVMCYSTALDANAKAIEARYGRQMLAETRGELPFSKTSAFARPWWPVITAEEPNVIGWKQWGLVPHWAAADPAAFLKKTPTFNAISEEAYEKRSFKAAMAAGHRCLIPVTAFYEWQHREVPGRKTPNKVPYEIGLIGEPLFSLGGIYDGDTYSILTRSAQTLMAQIHNTKKRQPVIIPRAFEGDWLSQKLTKDDVLRFCNGVEEIDLEAREVVKDSA